MKLYQKAPSPSTLRVTYFLAEKGLSIDTQEVDIRGGENLSESFAAKSWNGKTPTLETDDGDFICESVAICRYLEALHPGSPSLFGDSPLEQGQVEMWHRIVDLEGIQMAFQGFRNTSGIYKDRENCVPEWGEEAIARLNGFLQKLDKRLQDSQYIALDRFTIVDISAFVLVNFCRILKLNLSLYPALEQWQRRIGQRPAMQG